MLNMDQDISLISSTYIVDTIRSILAQMYRRYFCSLITDMPVYRVLTSATADKLRIAKEAADSVICLPIYPDLSEADQMRVIAGIHSASA